MTVAGAVLADIRNAAVVAVVRADTADHAARTIDALVAGGITGIEVTCTIPDSPSVIDRVGRRYGGQVVLGAGTITSAAQARDAVAAGARFLVSPGCEVATAEAMTGTGAAVVLGAMTPTEILTARSLGSQVVKIFPAALGGPAYLRALRAPFPDIPLMPTGGVTVANLTEWFDAGAFAVGAGGELCNAAAMAQGRWHDIEATARAFVAATRTARSQERTPA